VFGYPSMNKSAPDITLNDIDGVLEIIFNVYGYDFRDYARASIFRRIRRFMDDANIQQVYDLKYKLINDRSIFNFFLERLTVNVTEMFRDPTFYKALRKQVMPALGTYPIIKIWHTGCSTGEEVFSMAIMLEEAGLLGRSKIYATDINPVNIEKAKLGIMPLNVMKEYAQNYIKAGGAKDFASYYTANYEHAIIRKDLRDSIVFSQHNLVTDQVFNEFQLVCCRNVMIYFNKVLQNRVIQLFHESLSRFGFLALGLKESLLFTEVREKFEVINHQQKIFRRIN
jgi:chemotaxis protein methyltransferase CheR